MDQLAAVLDAFFAGRPDLPVASAYLFGSHADGREHRESDVDVAVLLDWGAAADARSRFELRVAIGSALVAALHRDEVDVIVLNDAPPLLARRIVTAGRRVYVRDPEADHAYVRDVQLRAADVEPFVERGRRRLLEGLSA